MDAMYEMLRAKNGGLKKEVNEFAKKLVNMPSDSLKEENVAVMVEKEMKDNGYDKVFRDKAGNVVGVIFGRENTPNVLLTSHMDAVAIGDAKEWSVDPFGAEIKEGKLFGRGAADCKAGLAAQVYAGVLLKRSILPLQGNVIVAATVAEENGLSNGTKCLLGETLPELGLKPDIAILGEPTNLGMYYGHDGWMEMKINVESANSFNVADAANAIKQELSTGYTGRGDFEVSDPVFSNSSAGCRAEINYRTRLNVSEDADAVVNQTERRAMQAAKPAGRVAVSAFVRKEDQTLYTGHRIMTQFITHAWASDPFCQIIERARQALEAGGVKVTPDKWKLGSLGMGTAGSVLLNQFKVPTIGYGPGKVEMAHAVDEYVELEKISEAVYGTAIMAHGIAGIPVCGWTLDEI
jgi:putative selenium metabolism hydrolase